MSALVLLILRLFPFSCGFRSNSILKIHLREPECLNRGSWKFPPLFLRLFIMGLESSKKRAFNISRFFSSHFDAHQPPLQAGMRIIFISLILRTVEWFIPRKSNFPSSSFRVHYDSMLCVVLAFFSSFCSFPTVKRVWSFLCFLIFPSLASAEMNLCLRWAKDLRFFSHFCDFYCLVFLVVASRGRRDWWQ